MGGGGGRVNTTTHYSFRAVGGKGGHPCLWVLHAISALHDPRRYEAWESREARAHLDVSIVVRPPADVATISAQPFVGAAGGGRTPGFKKNRKTRKQHKTSAGALRRPPSRRPTEVLRRLPGCAWHPSCASLPAPVASVAGIPRLRRAVRERRGARAYGERRTVHERPSRIVHVCAGLRVFAHTRRVSQDLSRRFRV